MPVISFPLVFLQSCDAQRRPAASKLTTCSKHFSSRQKRLWVLEKHPLLIKASPPPASSFFSRLRSALGPPSGSPLPQITQTDVFVKVTPYCCFLFQEKMNKWSWNTFSDTRTGRMCVVLLAAETLRFLLCLHAIDWVNAKHKKTPEKANKRTAGAHMVVKDSSLPRLKSSGRKFPDMQSIQVSYLVIHCKNYQVFLV